MDCSARLIDCWTSVLRLCERYRLARAEVKEALRPVLQLVALPRKLPESHLRRPSRAQSRRSRTRRLCQSLLAPVGLQLRNASADLGTLFGQLLGRNAR